MVLGFGVGLGDEDPAVTVVFQLIFSDVFVGTARNDLFSRLCGLCGRLGAFVVGRIGQIGLEDRLAIGGHVDPGRRFGRGVVFGDDAE